MSRMTFINLPVHDLGRAVAFYAAIGFDPSPEWCDGDAACLSIGPRLKLMLLRRDRFADFVVGPVADPAAATAAIVSLSADSRAEVDAQVDRALAHGGRAWKEPVDAGPLYGRSFTDPDGHVWETLFLDVGRGPVQALPTP
ncbi:hypothetical protein FHX74_000715 [Friedmanniella endophytica]|uniref:VOC domain-containing protein n=1 Tax=Microlunatus kandeliicorticis TaxID=1759536 RepID=A0A7W3IQ09_9ACTN|nr:VOC family protein [Microlunatus kandeliicorticis]MBA8793121.1 hypothetical protein [Microlunatus kandeliicorticis]